MSNLLDKASILTTPTAYDNGKILSVKPAPSLGSELVVNGDFATDSNWTKSANWTIANGKATSTGAGRMFQSIPFLETNIGTTVEVSFDITELTANSVVVNCYGGISESFTTVGTHTFTITTTNNTNLYFNNAGAGNLIGSIDNVSVKQVIDGDFDFTRNSSATRVNSQGLIEDVQILSSNLVSNGDFSQEGSEEVTNGDFATDSDWNKGSNWSILNGVATSNGSGLIQQSTSELTSGKTYKISFEITEYTSGGVKLYSGSGSDASTYKNTVGTHTDTLVLNGSTTSLYSNNFIGSITNVSVKEVGQDWTLGTGWSIGENKAVANNVPNGQRLQTSTTASVVGNKYKYSLNISNISGAYTLYIFGVNTLISVSTEGIVEGYVTATSTNGAIYISGATVGGLVSADISNISVIEITDDTNLPRIDYTGGEGHWLFEPQSTNLITYSSDFTQSYWRKDKVTVTANSIIAPSGELDASLIQETVYTSGIPSFDLLSSITLSAGTYTYTFYVKNNNGRYLGISFGSNSQRVRTNFDFNTNTFKTLIFNGTTTGLASFTALGDYYRISITATFPSSTAADTVIMPLATDTYPFYAFQNSDNRSFYLWGAQVEASSFATSYIPTNGSTVTRLQDAAFGSGSSDLINSTEGVLYAEIAALANGGVGDRYISLGSGSDVTNTVQLLYHNTANRINFRVTKGGSFQVNISDFTFEQTENLKIAVKFKANDFALWINGVERVTDTSGQTFDVGTLQKLQFDSGNRASDFFGKTKCVAVFKEALTDAELTCLTTI
jgi:hypothetical protein